MSFRFVGTNVGNFFANTNMLVTAKSAMRMNVRVVDARLFFVPTLVVLKFA